MPRNIAVAERQPAFAVCGRKQLRRRGGTDLCSYAWSSCDGPGSRRRTVVEKNIGSVFAVGAPNILTRGEGRLRVGRCAHTYVADGVSGIYCQRPRWHQRGRPRSLALSGCH